MTTTKRATPKKPEVAAQPNQMFELAAELFGVLSAPIRLKIIKSVCESEKNVSEILGEINTTQPNMSQHLNTLYKAGILGKRREGVQIYYRVIDARVTNLCHSVCSDISGDSAPFKAKSDF